MTKTGLLKTLGITGIGLVMLTTGACKRIDDIYFKRFDNPCGTSEMGTVPNMGYDYYAKKLKEEYPERLKGINYKDLSHWLQHDLNDNKRLDKHGTITLPEYDCLSKLTD
ncbi:MAG TPA: hypothetical protein ENG87_03340 [Candidatus Pacearchaeota archaeon]|nr:hypothetical protein BMS3Abin17_00557 [archaeon BMS3Abin17]HDK42388.1 hypothetical protein [Candidatus Pacearchaeota archaeon]HDZ60631.1 hypothetical protein [Candidatus Pacearchaeota archaeon]